MKDKLGLFTILCCVLTACNTELNTFMVIMAIVSVISAVTFWRYAE